MQAIQPSHQHVSACQKTARITAGSWVGAIGGTMLGSVIAACGGIQIDDLTTRMLVCFVAPITAGTLAGTYMGYRSSIDTTAAPVISTSTHDDSTTTKAIPNGVTKPLLADDGLDNA